MDLVARFGTFHLCVYIYVFWKGLCFYIWEYMFTLCISEGGKISSTCLWLKENIVGIFGNAKY